MDLNERHWSSQAYSTLVSLNQINQLCLASQIFRRTQFFSKPPNHQAGLRTQLCKPRRQ